MTKSRRSAEARGKGKGGEGWKGGEEMVRNEED